MCNYWVEMAAEAGLGAKFQQKKVKFFDLSCMFVNHITISAL